MSAPDALDATDQFFLRVENEGFFVSRPRVILALTATELRWQVQDASTQRRNLHDIRSVTLARFGLPRGGALWRCRVEFGPADMLSIICLSGEAGKDELYRQFVRLLHTHLLTLGKAADITFTVGRSGRLTRLLTLGILPLAGLGCLVSAFVTGQFMLLLMMGAFWIMALIQVEELRLNNGQRYDPAALPQALLP